MSNKPSGDSDERAAAEAWLKERVQPGNWINITVEEEIPAFIRNWDRTLVNMQQMVFVPEIRKRIEADNIPPDFLFWAGQLIQPLEGERIVRLNDEVRGVPYLRTGRAVEKGEQITLGDFAGLEVFDLVEDELDCGHFTIFWTGSGWVGSFDFRSGRAKCADLLSKALTFVEATRLATHNKLAEPAIDNLHTASELIAKARLILNHQPAYKWKSHGKVHSEANKLKRLGNIDVAFLDAFNRLSQTRGHAKYATGYEAPLPAWEEIDLIQNFALAFLTSVEVKRPEAMQPTPAA